MFVDMRQSAVQSMPPAARARDVPRPVLTWANTTSSAYTLRSRGHSFWTQQRAVPTQSPGVRHYRAALYHDAAPAPYREPRRAPYHAAPPQWSGRAPHHAAPSLQWPDARPVSAGTPLHPHSALLPFGMRLGFASQQAQAQAQHHHGLYAKQPPQQHYGLQNLNNMRF